ncbi:hypothetical protein PVAND_013233 [Polypedilum vanderplanki]|uniref:Leucine rich repeat protein n=1 Tax=Polypedilum vanderplanki TaxID=319348 RepID=A0A9J6CNW0_POLVA|nr:hypothetical protein PVAND_013233 [Polypedilum vanderplanki]
MNVIVKLIIVLAIFIASVNGIYIKCEIHNRSTVISDLNLPSIDRVEISRRYTCIGTVFLNQGKVNKVDHIYEASDLWGDKTGNHMKARDYRIKAIDLDDQDLFVIPKGISAYFSGLKSLSVDNCNIQRVTNEDIREFPKLTFFSAGFNGITELKSNLFEHNPNIQIVNFASNQIFVIGDLFLKNAMSMRILILEDNGCILENFEMHDIWSRKVVQKELSFFCSYSMGFGVGQNSQEDQNVYGSYGPDFIPYSAYDYGNLILSDEEFINVSTHDPNFVNCSENSHLVYDANDNIVILLPKYEEDFVNSITDFGERALKKVKEFFCDKFNICSNPNEIGTVKIEEIRAKISDPCFIDQSFCDDSLPKEKFHFLSNQNLMSRFCLVFPRMCQDSVDIRRSFYQYDEIDECTDRHKIIIEKDDQPFIQFLCKIYPEFCGLPSTVIDENETKIQSDYEYGYYDGDYSQSNNEYGLEYYNGDDNSYSAYCLMNPSSLHCKGQIKPYRSNIREFQSDELQAPEGIKDFLCNIFGCAQNDEYDNYDQYEYGTDPGIWDSITCIFNPNGPECSNRMAPIANNLQQYKHRLQLDPVVLEDLFCEIYGCSTDNNDQFGYDYQSDQPSIYDIVSCFFDSNHPECATTMRASQKNLKSFVKKLQSDPAVFENFYCRIFKCPNKNNGIQFLNQLGNNQYETEHQSDPGTWDDFICYISPNKCKTKKSDITGIWITPYQKRRFANESKEESIENSTEAILTLEINQTNKTENQEKDESIELILDDETSEFEVMITTNDKDEIENEPMVSMRLNDYKYYDDEYYRYDYEYTSYEYKYEYEYTAELNDEQYYNYGIKRSIEENNETKPNIHDLDVDSSTELIDVNSTDIYNNNLTKNEEIFEAEPVEHHTEDEDKIQNLPIYSTQFIQSRLNNNPEYDEYESYDYDSYYYYGYDEYSDNYNSYY